METGLITINSHEFHFKPFAYKLSLEGKLEIKSKYTIGTKILSGKLALPNQTVDLIDIVPNYKQSCQRRVSDCQVFTFRTFIQLSGDKYFAREFNESEEIPMQFSLDFDTSNLDSFRSYNYYFNPTSKFKNQPKGLSDYVSNIKQLKIDFRLRYQNSFYVERKVGEYGNIPLSVPVSWTIKDGAQNNTYRNVEFSFRNYDSLKNQYIKEWFSVKTNGVVKVDHSFISFKDGYRVNLLPSDMKRANRYGWNSFQLEGTIKKDNGEYKHEPDYQNSGIFFSSPTRGVLNSKLFLLLNNHGYFISVKNPFSFVGLRKGSSDLFIRVWIQNKSDYYFSDLRKFKFINL